jgi:hypothetical protein
MGKHVGFGGVNQAREFREAVVQSVCDGASFLVGTSLHVLRERGADRGGHHLALLSSTWASALRIKCIRHRCHFDERTLRAAFFKPSWLSEITSLTPRKPRRVSERGKLVQNGSASKALTCGPSTSRHPTASIPSRPPITAR